MRGLCWSLLLLATGCAVAPKQPASLAAAAPPVTSAVEPSAGPVATPWPQASDCRSLAAALVALSDEERARLDPAAAPIAVAATIPVIQDFPAAAAPGGRCRLEVAQLELVAAPRPRPISVSTVTSAYNKGSRRTTNARWTELKGAEEEIEDEASAPGILRTGDPSLDLIGLFAGAVIGGVDRARKAWAKRDVDDELARTERYADEAQWAPYTYELETVEAERAALFEAALEDASARVVAKAAPLVRERRRFEVAKGRHRSDRALLEETATAVSENELRIFQGQAPAPKASELLRAALTGRVDQAPVTVAAERATPVAGARAEPGTSAVREEVGPDGVRRFRLR